MTESDLRKLLGTTSRDPGCDGAFAVFDEYCDAVRRGDPPALVAYETETSALFAEHALDREPKA